jgi:phosphate:Na+ symporter
MITDVMLGLGGVGLFVVGMLMLTDSLRGLAGRSLRDALARFTRTPLSGALTGAVTTALVQSSSATTVTVIGFVSAGLMTFAQALGVIFGANLGTTTTGWVIAILGFKLHLGELVWPLVFVGALLKMFGAGRSGVFGMALVGFSFLFIGIDTMQAGMAPFEGAVTPSDLPDDTLIGRAELVLIGAVVTAITQSSAAGIAAALVALGSGAIDFTQAAAMVIGMNVGTTCTAMLATLGGSTATRRTGWAHLIFNVVTGVIAFALLVPLTALIESLVGEGDGQIALVSFHTAFNILGIALFLPVTDLFARLVTWLVRERGPPLTRHLGHNILRDPDAATDAAAATVRDIARAELALLTRRLDRAAAERAKRADAAEMRDIADALAAVRDFIDKIKHGEVNSPRARRIAAGLHVLDHLGRLYYRCAQSDIIANLASEHRLRRLRGVLRDLCDEAAGSDADLVSEVRLNRLRKLLRAERKRYRERTIMLASTGRISDETALGRLDTIRWLHRVSYHLWRIQHHLNRMREAGAPASAMREAAVEVLHD